MSTILKALKRAEQDCHDLENQDASSLKMNVRATLGSRMQRQKAGGLINARHLMFFMSLAGVIAIASYFIVFGNRDVQSRHSSQKVISQPPGTPPAKRNDQNTHVRQNERPAQTGSGQKKEIKRETMPAPSFDTKIVDPAKNKPMPISKIPHLKSPGKPSPLEIMEKITPRPALQAVSRPNKKEQADAERLIPLEAGILRLQAISWAAAPADRIVVINDKVVGEGESVQGYRLLRIEKDEVILQQSGQKYKLDFKYR